MTTLSMDNNIDNLIAYGKELEQSGLTLGTGGNLSFYDRSQDLMYISPSGIPFGEIKPDHIVVLDREGKTVRGHLKPSSEWAMHLIFYQKREDIDAVIHAHTTYATVFAVLHQTLPASHYMLAVAGKDVPCAEYASYGTPELARNAYEAMKDRKACILANHGIIAGGANLGEAFNIIREVEYCAKIHIMAKALGEPCLIPDDEMARMGERFKTYGQGKVNV